MGREGDKNYMSAAIQDLNKAIKELKLTIIKELHTKIKKVIK